MHLHIYIDLYVRESMEGCKWNYEDDKFKFVEIVCEDLELSRTLNDLKHSEQQRILEHSESLE